MKILLLLMLLLPQLAAAKVYMCVDPKSGKTLFSDTGCKATAATEEVRIDPTNVDSGRNTRGAVAKKAWASERDTRKTGRDYEQEKRRIKENNATASTGRVAGH